jgi:nucleotide-binding universal stress UspA family protein
MRAANTLFSDGQSRIQLRQVRSADVGAMILEESQRDYDLLLLGAAPTAPLHDALTRHLVDVSRIPLVIVRHGAEAPWLRVLVAVDGSLFSRYAAEFAFAYAGGAGSEVTLLHVVGEEAASFGSDVHAAERDVAHAIEASIRSNLGALGEAHGVEFAVRVVASASAGATIVAESNSGYYDLLVLGAENKRIAQPLFHGQGTAEILERSGCATAVVVPRVD